MYSTTMTDTSDLYVSGYYADVPAEKIEFREPHNAALQRARAFFFQDFGLDCYVAGPGVFRKKDQAWRFPVKMKSAITTRGADILGYVLVPLDLAQEPILEKATIEIILKRAENIRQIIWQSLLNQPQANEECKQG